VLEKPQTAVLAVRSALKPNIALRWKKNSGRAAKEFLHHLPITAPRCESLTIAQNEHLIALIKRLGSADVRSVHDH
jgi:hypothetical protein